MDRLAFKVACCALDQEQPVLDQERECAPGCDREGNGRLRFAADDVI